jgi:hypothetical protein
VRHGKLYSLAIPAGKDSIPDWVYEPYVVGPLAEQRALLTSIPLIQFRDGASELEDDTCGAAVPIASPTHPRYQQYYADLLTGLAAHLKTRADWFRALAYIKPAGANLFTDEARLPKRCKTIDVDPADGVADCVCNTQLWAENGYTPDGLYRFYRDQTALISQLFPGKTMAYQLIQDGFPRVSYDGSDWLVGEGLSATTHSGAPLSTLPGAFEQTVEILNNGQADHTTRFAIQHNGLKADPQNCATAGLHPADLPWQDYSEVGSGCPNKWVLREGAEGQVTGFQTSNKKEVNSPDTVEATLENAMNNSDAVFVELYEERIWEIAQLGLSSGKSLRDWADGFHDRRHLAFPGSAIFDPLPVPGTNGSFSHTFFKATAGTTLYYVHGSKCLKNGAWGQISVR